MLAKVFIFLFLIGLHNTVSGDDLADFEKDPNKVECKILCQTCVVNVRGIRWALLQDYVREALAKLFNIMCNFLPYRKPRASCKAFFNGPFKQKLHDFAVNMSVYEPCKYIGLCLTAEQNVMQNAYDAPHTDTLMQAVNIIKQYLQATVTPEYIDQTITQICSSDDKCVKILKNHAKHFVKEIF
ncbi:unnamed protein product [Heterobilharzia americana]|nr:unnamed protein product [Heterobilharzia americana]CAH8509376.1 unnamed protein product [Heterobilharzia americana]